MQTNNTNPENAVEAEIPSTPNIPSYVAVHNKSLYNDFISSIRYNTQQSNGAVTSTNNNTRSFKRNLRNTKSSPTFTKYVNVKNINGNNVAITNAKKLESKRKKILKYHTELEKWRQNDLKRTYKMIEFKKNKDEAEFRKRLNMIESRGGIYSEVSNVLYRDEMQHKRKVNNLYGTWNSKVYGPIIKHIKTKANNADYMMRKKDKMRNLYDKYLKECNKNGNKIFLDSINVKEYDPFEWEKECEDDVENHSFPIKKLSKKNKVKIHDPLKADLNKYITEQRISNNTSRYFHHNKHNHIQNMQDNQKENMSNEFSSDTINTDSNEFGSTMNNMNKSNTFSLKPKTRFCVSPVEYNHVSHLPLFRDMEMLNKTKNKCILPSHVPGGNILLNQKEIPAYNADIVRKQYFPQTKRIVRPPFAKYEFKISEMW